MSSQPLTLGSKPLNSLKICHKFLQSNTGFLLRILWCSQIWLCTRYESTKKKQNPSIFLATNWNWSKKSGDLKNKKFQNLMNLGHFFPWKILGIGRNHIFQVKIWRKIATKGNTGATCVSCSVWLGY
jgi:hypothetical protein